MDSIVRIFTNIFLALGLRGRMETLINEVIDIAIQEGKEEIDATAVFSEEEKVVAKTGIDLLAARLKTLVSERL